MNRTVNLVPQDFMLDTRPRRLPLQEWADELLGTLCALRIGNADSYRQAATCLNLCALVETYRGDRKRARDLCEGQLLWLSRLYKRHVDVRFLELALQPWINIGRLHRIERDFESSLDHFSLLTRYRDQSAIDIGPCHLAAHQWREIQDADPSFEHILENVYVIDSLKSLFAMKDHARALDFIRQQRGSRSPSLLAYLTEAEIIGLANSAQYAKALDVAKTPEPGDTLFDELVFLSYQASLLALMGELTTARDLARKLAACLSITSADDARDQRALRYLYFLGSINEFTGGTDVAHVVYQHGYHTAVTSRDQPMTLSFVHALLGMGLSDAARWREEQGRLLRDSLYPSVLRREHPRPEAGPDPRFDQLFAAATELMASTPSGGIDQ